MSDLISRKATINTVINMRNRCGNDINDFYDLLIESVKVLPSAEPEIIRCKDCKNYYPDEDGRGYHCERDSNVRFSVHKDFYCADAERRTDERLDIQTECD